MRSIIFLIRNDNLTFLYLDNNYIYVTSNEVLLEVCGCSKDKCKEYADYCKKIIEQVDKK